MPDTVVAQAVVVSEPRSRLRASMPCAVGAKLVEPPSLPAFQCVGARGLREFAKRTETQVPRPPAPHAARADAATYQWVEA